MRLKTLLRPTLIVGAAALAVLPSLTAFAAPPPDVFKDSQGNIFIHGSLASSLGENARAQTNEPLTCSVWAGYCGEIRLSPSSTLPSIGNSWTLNGQTRQRTNLPVVTDRTLLPTCSGNTLAGGINTTILNAGGFVDNTTTTSRVVLLGYTPGISYPVVFNGVPRSISLNANACGLYRIGNTTTTPAPTALEINGQNYTTANLPVAVPPLCSRNTTTGDYIRYIPGTW